MKDEVIKYLSIKPDGKYVDMTLGFAGHSKAILKHLNVNGHLYGVDQDPDAIQYCKNDNSLTNATNFTILQMNFVDFKKWAYKHSINGFDGFLFDLGVSSHQIDNLDRGFSYLNDSLLDMRMDQSKKLTAKKILAEYDFQQLSRIFQKYGEINKPYSVVNAIIKQRGKVNTTRDFVDLINANTPMAVKYKNGINKHIEKKYFLALRIFVNNELENLEKAVYDAATLLKINGRIVIIAYHSLELKCVKRKLSHLTKQLIPDSLPINNPPPDFVWITKKAITPTSDEIKSNSRSHSAKLICLEREK